MSIALFIIVIPAVPTLALFSRSWFFEPPRSVHVWAALSGAALLAVGMVMKVIPGNSGDAAIAATPLLQAVVFVIGDRLFLLLTGRVPVSSTRARWERRADGRHWWPDKLFWALTLLGLMGVAFLCLRIVANARPY